MKKFFKKSMTIGVVLSMLFGNVNALADELNKSSNNKNLTIEDNIDQYIYDMVDAYDNGTFVEHNDSKTLKPSNLFSESSTMSKTNDKVDYIYDISKVDEDTYKATQVAFLEDTRQGSNNGVAMFCTIVYDEKDFGRDWSYIMLTRVKAGVIRETGDYECKRLRIRYKVHGDAYDEDGKRYGYKGDETYFSDYSVNNPIVGPAYSMPGPCDYYYNMGAYNGFVGGFAEGKIGNDDGDTSYLDIPNVIESMD